MNMNKINKILIASVLLIVFSFIMFFGIYQFTKNVPGGTDFLYRWLPTRMALQQGNINVYNDKATLAVEYMHYGRPHQPGETPGIFAYPYYSMFWFVPFTLFNSFALARAVWMMFMLFFQIGIIFLSLHFLKTKVSIIYIAGLLLLGTMSADMAQAIIDGNIASLAAFLTALCLFFIYKEFDIAAGIALALSTIKPQLVILFIPLIILWAFSQKRWKIIVSSAVAFATMNIIAFAIYPGWLSAFLQQLKVYTDVASPSTPSAIFSNWMAPGAANILGWVLTVISFVMLLYAWINCFQKDFRYLFWATCLTFTLMPITGITSAKSNYVAMLPAIVLLMMLLIKHHKMRPWQWVSGVSIYIIASWFFIWAGRSLYIGNSRLYFIDFYPLPIILLIGLFALRKQWLTETPINRITTTNHS
jgi:hypothetical protein